uniref:Uncharacterized protein n=1 Tax=Arundo donax TaxID=35708 RepID=A0A0A8Z661_ARUDO
MVASSKTTHFLLLLLPPSLQICQKNISDLCRSFTPITFIS